MERSRGAIKAVLGPLGRTPPLGALWGLLGAILMPEKQIGRQNKECKTIISLRCLKGFSFLEASFGNSQGSLNHLGAVSMPLGGMSEIILSHI